MQCTCTMYAVQLRMLQQTNELQLCPLNTVMKRILDSLARKDPADIFAEVVNAEEVNTCICIGVGVGVGACVQKR